jgi:hypothetical protein
LWLQGGKLENEQNASAPTAQEIFGLPQGSQVVLERTMAEHIFRMVASKRPDMTAALDSLHGQTATVTVANDDLVDIRLNGRVNIGTGYDDVTVQLVRANELFSMSISGTGAPPLLHEVTDLMVSRDGEKFVLASGEPRVRFTPRSGTVTVEAFTALFLKDAPAMVRMLAPNLVGLFSVTVANKDVS